MKRLSPIIAIVLLAISSCATGGTHAGPVTISTEQLEYVIDRPITFEIRNTSGKRLLYWVQVDRLGSDGEWYLTYSSLLGMRQDSEPAMAVLRSQERQALFWLPTVDSQFRDLFDRTESRTFRLTLKYIETENEVARSVEGKAFKLR